MLGIIAILIALLASAVFTVVGIYHAIKMLREYPSSAERWIPLIGSTIMIILIDLIMARLTGS